MSAEKKTTVVQASIQTPSIHDVNPLESNDPLIKTLVNGELPSNSVINEAIDKAKDSLESSKREASSSHELNARGELLAKDASEILETAQRFINEKNNGEKIQDLLRHTKEAAEQESSRASSTLSSLSSLLHLSTQKLPTQEAKRDANQAINYGRELMLYALRSPELRSILLDFINLFQSSLSVATEKVQQVGDSVAESLKSDVVSGKLDNTTETLKQTGDDIKQSIESTSFEWNEQTQREYYNKFSRLLSRISEKREYKQLLDYYWKWMDELKERANSLTETLKSKAEEVKSEIENFSVSSSTDKVWNDIRGIFDDFCGKGSFDSIYKEAWDVYCFALNDRETNEYFAQLKSFITMAVENPSLLQREDKIKEGEQLLTRGRNLLNKTTHSRRFNQLFEHGRQLLNKIVNDATTNEFTDKLKLFGQHFALDSEGRPDLNVIQDSLTQIKNLLYPILSKQLSVIPIARVAGTNDYYDWSVENLTLNVPDLIPEYFQLRTKNFLSVNVREMETEKNNTKVTLEIKNLRPAFRDMKFWYQRKSFPRIEDYGTCDIDLSKGEGAKIKIIWKIKSKANRPFAFSLLEVKCVIDSLEVTVKDAKHELLDRIATSLFAANIKQSVAQGIVNQLVDALSPFNDQMNDWFATRPVASMLDKANEQLHNAYQQTNAFIKDQPLQKTIDKVSETVNYIKDTASDKLSEASSIIADKAQEAKEFVKEKSEEVKEVVENVKEKVEEKKEEVTNAWDHAWQSKSHKRRNHKKKRHHEFEVVPISSETEFPALPKHEPAWAQPPPQNDSIDQKELQFLKAEQQVLPAK